MNLIFEKLVVLSKIENKGFEISFDEGMNIIIGGNKSGKSCIAKSIMHTLGCDVVFEQEWIDLKNIYLLFFTFNDENYALSRVNLNEKKKALGANFFILNNITKNESYKFKNVTDLSKHLNSIFEFKIQLQNRAKENELTQIYPNHMFLLNYVDQDTSWGSLLEDTYDNLNFLADYKVSILEYLLGFRDNDYYEKIFEKNKQEKLLNEKNLELNNLKSIVNQNNFKLSSLEDVDVEKFKVEYEKLLENYSKVLKMENDYKIQISDLYSRMSFFYSQQENNKRTIENLKANVAIEKCPVCSQVKEHETTEIYNIEVSIWELEKQIEESKLKYNELKNQFDIQRKSLAIIEAEAVQIENTLKDKQYKIEFIKKITDLGMSRVVEKLDLKIRALEKCIDTIKTTLKELKDSIRKIETDKSIIVKYYSILESAFKDLKVKFQRRDDRNLSFLGFRTNYSGTDKQKAFIAFYTIVNYLLKQRNLNIPFVLDTPFKEDFDEPNIKIVFDLLVKYFYGDNCQQSLIFTSNNASISNVVRDMQQNKVEIIGERSLFNQNFDELYEKYSNYFLGC